MLDYKGWVDTFFKESDEVNIIEVGVYKGDFAVRLLNAAFSASPLGKISYTGIDLFEPLDNDMLLEENSLVPPPIETVYKRISRDCPFALVGLHEGDSADILPKLLENISKADLIYIDAGHSVKSIANDWTIIQTAIKPSALIIFDDYYEDRLDCGAKNVVDSIDLNIWEVELTKTRSCETRIGVVDLRQALVRQRSRFRKKDISGAMSVILEPIEGVPRLWEEETEATIKLIKSFVDDDARVCDIGCGIGRISLQLSKSVAHIDCVDSSPEMVDLLYKQVASKKVINLTVFSTEKWLGMSKKLEYDTYLAFYVFQHVPLLELEKLLDGITKHANPKSKLLVINTPNRYIPEGSSYFDDDIKVSEILSKRFGKPEILPLNLLGSEVSDNHFGHAYQIVK